MTNWANDRQRQHPLFDPEGVGEDSFVELWDQSLALEGLAFFLNAPEHGPVTITGYDVAVPFDVFERFMDEGKVYLGEYIAAMPKTDQ